MVTAKKLKPTILPEGEAALVTTDNLKGGFDLYIPELPPDAVLPKPVLFLTACLARAHDEKDFVNSMIEWLNDRVFHADAGE